MPKEGILLKTLHILSNQPTKCKDKYKISNWSAYKESLKQRGSITIWFSEDAISSWEYNEKRKRGGKIVYSDIAIETCLYKLKS